MTGQNYGVLQILVLILDDVGLFVSSSLQGIIYFFETTAACVCCCQRAPVKVKTRATHVCLWISELVREKGLEVDALTVYFCSAVSCAVYRGDRAAHTARTEEHSVLSIVRAAWGWNWGMGPRGLHFRSLPVMERFPIKILLRYVCAG
jgi:hypothetical protein